LGYAEPHTEIELAEMQLGLIFELELLELIFELKLMELELPILNCIQLPPNSNSASHTAFPALLAS